MGAALKISEVEMVELIDAIGLAIVPVLFKGVDKDTPAYVMRERANVNAEIMGRFAAMLYCGDEVGMEVLDLIAHFTAYMQVEHQHSMKRFLGPDGGMSKLRQARANKGSIQ